MNLLRPPPAEARVVQSLALVVDRAVEARLVARLAAVEHPTVVAFVNAHGLNLGRADPTFADRLIAADLLLRDGIGMSLALRFLGGRPGLNMNGTDLIPKLITAYAGRRAAIVGTVEPWLSRAAAQVADIGVEPVVCLNGYLPDAAYLDAIPPAAPDLVLLGMGMPKQERVALALRAAMTGPALIVNGGAFLDFLAARVPRAPVALRRLGLEWAFRLAVEPKRLAGRYVGGMGPFAWNTLRLRARGTRSP